MGYDIHVTRRKFWADSGDDITRAEFFAAVAKDSSFKRSSSLGEDYAEWRNSATGYESWLYWCDGQIETKNPDESLVAKAIELAQRLDAAVQGDDGEIYSAPLQKTKPGWKLWWF